MEEGSADYVAMRRVLIFCLAAAAASAAGPSVVTQPGNIEVPAGCPATLLVTATGDAPLAYQWWLGGEAVAAGTVSRYTFTTTEITAEPASYWVVVTNISGSVTSSAATISVTAAADCPKQGLPKIRVGGRAVSLMIKAERFLPLMLVKSLENLVSGITNAEQAGAARAMMHPLTRGLPLSVSSNVVYSNTWFLKGIKGVTAGSLGQWGSELAAASNCAANFHYCCGDTNGWGMYQVPCVLVNRRFTISPGHTGKWTDTNCYEKWVGTNGQAYFINSLETVDFLPPPCRGATLPAHIVELAIELGYPTNFDGKVTLLASEMPADVESAVLWPTNLVEYVAQTHRDWPRAGVQTGQYAQWCVVPAILTSGGLPAGDITFGFHNELDLYHVPLGAGGSSGSPRYDILGDQAVLTDGYSGIQYREMYEAAMLYLWTNNAMSAETCPGLTYADLSGYDKLR